MQLLMQGLGKEAATDVAKPNANTKSDVPQDGETVFATFLESSADSVEVDDETLLQVDVTLPKDAGLTQEDNAAVFTLTSTDLDLQGPKARPKPSDEAAGKDVIQDAAVQGLTEKLPTTTVQSQGPNADGKALAVPKTLGTQNLVPAISSKLNALASKAASVDDADSLQGRSTTPIGTNEQVGPDKKVPIVVSPKVVASQTAQTTDTDLSQAKTNVDLDQVSDVRTIRRDEKSTSVTPQAPVSELKANTSKREVATPSINLSKAAARGKGQPELTVQATPTDADRKATVTDSSDLVPGAAAKVATDFPQPKPSLSLRAEARVSRMTARDSVPDAAPNQTAQGVTPQDPTQTVQISVFKSEALFKDGIFARDPAHGPSEGTNPIATAESSDAKRIIDQVLTRTEAAAKPVISQLVQAAKAGIDGTIEVKLSPEELGRVKMTMMPGEAGMTVQVLAERPETLDLIRRHIDMLASDLSDQGFKDLSFSFGDGATNGDDAKEDTGNGNAAAASVPQDQSNPLHYSMAINDGHLDIRL